MAAPLCRTVLHRRGHKTARLNSGVRRVKAKATAGFSASDRSGGHSTPVVVVFGWPASDSSPLAHSGIVASWFTAFCDFGWRVVAEAMSAQRGMASGCSPLTARGALPVVQASVQAALRALHFRGMIAPNNSFKPTPLRCTNNMADAACHVVGSTTQRGLTQALGL